MSRIDVGTDRYSVNSDTYENNFSKNTQRLPEDTKTVQTAKRAFSEDTSNLSTNFIGSSCIAQNGSLSITGPLIHGGKSFEISGGTFIGKGTIRLTRDYPDPLTFALFCNDFDRAAALVLDDSFAPYSYSKVLHQILKAKSDLCSLEERSMQLDSTILQAVNFLFEKMKISGELSLDAFDFNPIFTQMGCFFLQCGRYDLLEQLLSSGLDINGWQEALLRSAIELDDLVAAEFLFEHGAKLNDSTGQKFYSALQKRNYNMIKLLIQHGAEVNKMDYASLSTPLDYVKNHHNSFCRKEIIELLEIHGAVSNEVERGKHFCEEFKDNPYQLSPIKYALKINQYLSAKDILSLIQDPEELLDIMHFFYDKLDLEFDFSDNLLKGAGDLFHDAIVDRLMEAKFPPPVVDPCLTESGLNRGTLTPLETRRGEVLNS